MKTLRLTMAQALLKFIDNQYISIDDKETKFVEGVIGIFGHGNVTGLGEALEFEKTNLKFIQGHNEQGMVHTATAFARQNNRLKIMACTSSIGPGATNMVTGAATATTNRIPVLLLPGDQFACRQPDPVLQQLENASDHTLSVNDCFKPVSKYWDRVVRPEQLMVAMNNAFRVLTDPVETGAVTICLPQDVQAEAYDYPIQFFAKKVHHIDRRLLSKRALLLATDKIRAAKKPLILAGGGVKYSLAESALSKFSHTFGIPVAQTQAGKSALASNHHYCVGGIGVTGTEVANILASEADLILAIGTRMSDFTTASKNAFMNDSVEILQLNVSLFDAVKMNGQVLLADAKAGLSRIYTELEKYNYKTSPYYQNHVAELKTKWQLETASWYQKRSHQGIPQTAVIGALNNYMDTTDVIVAAAGSLPGDLHRLWRTQGAGTYHVEYAYSCMGYEVAGGLGVKMANPEREVYVIVGDGSYLMMHSEIVTSLQEGYKVNIILLDNQGYRCIQNLQKAHGSQGFGNEFKAEIDFAAYARSLGVKSFQAKDIDGFESALLAARQEPSTTLIEIKVLPDSMSSGYKSWWRVGVAEVSKEPLVEVAHTEMKRRIEEAMPY